MALVVNRLIRIILAPSPRWFEVGVSNKARTHPSYMRIGVSRCRIIYRGRLIGDKLPHVIVRLDDEDDEVDADEGEC